MIFYQDNHITNYNMDFRQNDLPDECVQMVVTSPPYWGLRKYAGEQDLIWGGDNHHEHKWGEPIPRAGYRSNDNNPGALQSIATQNRNIGGSNYCQLCGAWRVAYGLEPTPEMYVEHTIEILREIRRVLRKDGVVFWNIGDSYNSAASNQSGNLGNAAALKEIGHRTPLYKGLKTKDLCLIPFRVALAAQQDGWWVRSDIIWSKPNPMPESVKDRPTESHEHILMLTKSSRYYWDMEAVREKGTMVYGDSSGSPQMDTSINYGIGCGNSGINKAKEKLAQELKDNGVSSRNIRSVWEFPTQPYPDAHFAVFPEKLPETCIKASTSEKGCCSKCGAPWVRIVENKPMVIRRSDWRELAGNRTASSGTMISPPNGNQA